MFKAEKGSESNLYFVDKEHYHTASKNKQCYHARNALLRHAERCTIVRAGQLDNT